MPITKFETQELKIGSTSPNMMEPQSEGDNVVNI
jgi:hypothetical protein